MKTIRTIFAILFLSSLFIACEAEAADDQVGIDYTDVYGEEDDNDDVENTGENGEEDDNDNVENTGGQSEEDDNDNIEN